MSPDCLRIERSVPRGKSFLGCGTVTKPVIIGCLK